MVSILVRGLLIALGIALIAGCHRAWVSHAQVSNETGWHVKTYGGIGRFIVGPDMDILIKASNSTDERKTNEFGVSLWFDPKWPSLKFNPSEVVLNFFDIGEIRPAQINIKWTGANRGTDWQCGRTQHEDFGPGPPYQLRPGFCTELFFNIKSPSPETPFTMHIAGLTRDDKPVIIPDILFMKSAVTVIDLPLFP